MSKKESTAQCASDATIQEIFEGGIVPEIRNEFEDLFGVALMVPMGNPAEPECHWGAPCLWWGLNSVAKSQRIKQAAAKYDLPLGTTYPSQRQPEEFGDLAVVIWNENTNQDELRTACMLHQINKLNACGKGIWFVDEVGDALRATQGALLSAVLEKMLGSTPIHPQIRIMMAANPPSFSTNGHELASALSSRSMHFYVHPPTSDQFNAHLLQDGAPPVKAGVEAAMDKVRKEWPSEWAKTKGLLMAYHDHTKGSTLHRQPMPDHPQSSYCWPSPRMWETAARCWATTQILKPPGYAKLCHLFVEGAVGIGAATEFVEFAANADLPEPKEFLAKGKIDKKRLDRTLAMYGAATTYVMGLTNPKEQLEYGALLWGKLDEAVEESLSDIAYKYAEALLRNNLGGSRSKLQAASDPVILKLGLSRIAEKI